MLGAGFGGVLAAYHLTKQGVEDFVLLDTAGDFGGVWYWNRYPGIQCDNDAYCYLPLLEETGFVPSKKFADGWEIQGYIRQIAEQFGFADKGLFHTQVTSLVWDDAKGRWLVETNRGDRIAARFVVMANGVLNMPDGHPARDMWDTFYTTTPLRRGEPWLCVFAARAKSDTADLLAVRVAFPSVLQATPRLVLHAEQDRARLASA